MNPGAGDQFYPYGEFAQYPRHPPGWIYLNMLNDRGNVNHSPSASVTNAQSLPESSPQFIENSTTPSSSSTSSRPTSSAESKKDQDRWSKEEDKLLVQLWASVLFCSQILFSSAIVAFRTIFLSLADFKSDLSWTNLKLPSSATWPLN